MVKNILITIILAIGLVGCGTNTGADNSQERGDTYVVAVDNVGDGDITINTGSGTLEFNQDGECTHTSTEGNVTLCTQDQLVQASDVTELALFRE